jgi:hypothetical protein
MIGYHTELRGEHSNQHPQHIYFITLIPPSPLSRSLLPYTIFRINISIIHHHDLDDDNNNDDDVYFDKITTYKLKTYPPYVKYRPGRKGVSTRKEQTIRSMQYKEKIDK